VSKKKYELPQVLLNKHYKVREAEGPLCVPLSANVDSGELYVYGEREESGAFPTNIHIDLKEARRLGLFIRDVIGLD